MAAEDSLQGNVFGQQAGSEEQFNQYAIFRQFAGVRNSAPAWQVGDNEFSSLINAMPSEDGNIQAIPGCNPSPFYTGSSGLSISCLGTASRNNNTFIYIFFSDGSCKEYNINGALNHTFAAGTFCSGPQNVGSGTMGSVFVCTAVTSWEDSVTLFADPVKGYISWNGLSVTVISNTTLGYTIAVHQGIVWIGNGRTVRFTGQGGYNDLNVATGAGAFTTRTDAIVGVIIQLVETTTYLYIQTTTAVAVIGSTQYTNGITTFAVQLLTDAVGQAPGTTSMTVAGIPVFMSQTGIYSLSSSQPELVSEALRGTFGSYNLSFGPLGSTCGLAYWNGLTVPVFLVGDSNGNALLLCYANGKWFFATDQKADGTRLGVTNIITAWQNGIPYLFGATSGANGDVYNILATPSIAIPVTIVPRAWDFGNAIMDKTLLRLGIEGSFPASQTVNCTLTGYSQAGTQTNTVALPNTIAGFNLLYADAQIPGKYISITLTFTMANWQVSGFHLEYGESSPW